MAHILLVPGPGVDIRERREGVGSEEHGHMEVVGMARGIRRGVAERGRRSGLVVEEHRNGPEEDNLLAEAGSDPGEDIDLEEGLGEGSGLAAHRRAGEAVDSPGAGHLEVLAVHILREVLLGLAMHFSPTEDTHDYSKT